MPTVYEVHFEDGYQQLNCVNQQGYLQERKRSWRFDGLPVGNTWKPLEMYVRQPTLIAPDIWQIGGAIAFEPKAAEILAMPLNKAGELLPLSFQGRELTVLNVTYVIDCLDVANSEFPPTLPHMIEEFAFFADRLDYSLFKIPQTRKSSMIYTVEGLAAPEEEFKPLVETHKLTGLRFQKIWSS